MEKYRESIVFYVYQRREETYYLIGRLVHDSSQLAPLKRDASVSVKVNALSVEGALRSCAKLQGRQAKI
jgi:hypothetical protein